MKVTKHNKLKDEFFKSLNAEWAISPEIGDYIQGDVVTISQEEADAYYEAANTLYIMFTEAGDYVLENGMLEEMGIHPNLTELIKYTWDNDNHWHLYGRFDFAGGVDGEQIKLIEFNADTATSLPECAVFQWAHLKDNGFNNESQFNSIFENLVHNFKILRQMNPDKEPNILFTHMDSDEDKANVELMSQAAVEAGFDVEFRFLPEITFSDDESEGGVWVDYGEDRHRRFDFWFKLLPWEFLAEDEPELIELLTSIAKNEQCVILNPAYTMLFQSKVILKVLWDLFPEHPLLLKTTTEKPEGIKYVEKVIFGREGANVSIRDENDEVMEEQVGEYESPTIFQEYVELSTDNGQSYQAGVFFIGEGAGLGFRRGTKIMNDTAEFVSHYIED